MNATDQIDYTRPFSENVKGTLYARFLLDADGVPIYEVDNRSRFYTVDVYLVSPRADEIEEVSYFYDDPSEPNPLGASTDRANDFRATIESPGDARLRVEVRIGSHVYEQRAWLSQMLDNGYPKDSSPAIRAAILYIRVN